MKTDAEMILERRLGELDLVQRRNHAVAAGRIEGRNGPRGTWSETPFNWMYVTLMWPSRPEYIVMSRAGVYGLWHQNAVPLGQ